MTMNVIEGGFGKPKDDEGDGDHYWSLGEKIALALESMGVNLEDEDARGKVMFLVMPDEYSDDTGLFQFATDLEPEEVLALLELIKQRMVTMYELKKAGYEPAEEDFE